MAIPLLIPSVSIASTSERLQEMREDELKTVLATHANGAKEDLRRCALGIMHTGAATDNSEELLGANPDFDIGLSRR